MWCVREGTSLLHAPSIFPLPRTLLNKSVWKWQKSCPFLPGFSLSWLNSQNMPTKVNGIASEINLSGTACNRCAVGFCFYYFCAHSMTLLCAIHSRPLGPCNTNSLWGLREGKTERFDQCDGGDLALEI